MTKKSGDVVTLFLDADSFLEIKAEGKTKIRGQEMEGETAFGDYKEVGGLIFAHSIQSKPKGAPEGQGRDQRRRARPGRRLRPLRPRRERLPSVTLGGQGTARARDRGRRRRSGGRRVAVWILRLALLAVVFALSTALIWLVPFQWTPPRVVA